LAQAFRRQQAAGPQLVNPITGGDISNITGQINALSPAQRSSGLNQINAFASAFGLNPQSIQNFLGQALGGQIAPGQAAGTASNFLARNPRIGNALGQLNLGNISSLFGG
jgi:hypothetical protein